MDCPSVRRVLPVDIKGHIDLLARQILQRFLLRPAASHHHKRTVATAHVPHGNGDHFIPMLKTKPSRRIDAENEIRFMPPKGTENPCSRFFMEPDKTHSPKFVKNGHVIHDAIIVPTFIDPIESFRHRVMIKIPGIRIAEDFVILSIRKFEFVFTHIDFIFCKRFQSLSASHRTDTSQPM